MAKTRKQRRSRQRGGDPPSKIEKDAFALPAGWSFCTSELRKVGTCMETYDAICRKLCFKSFMNTGKGNGAVEFISALAPKAQEKMHHPELKNSYNKLEITFTTHDAKGLSQLDLDLANEVNTLLASDAFKDRMSIKDC